MLCNACMYVCTCVCIHLCLHAWLGLPARLSICLSVPYCLQPPLPAQRQLLDQIFGIWCRTHDHWWLVSVLEEWTLGYCRGPAENHWNKSSRRGGPLAFAEGQQRTTETNPLIPCSSQQCLQEEVSPYDSVKRRVFWRTIDNFEPI